MSLRSRVVVAIAVLLLSGSVVGTAVAGWQAKQVLREELVAALAGGRETVVGVFDSLPRSDHPGRDLFRAVAAFDGARHVKARLVDAGGRVLRVSHPLPVTPAPAWFGRLFQPHVADIVLPTPSGRGERVILSPLTTNDVAALWTEFIALAAVLSASFLIGSGLVWLIVGRALRPLSDVSAAFVTIGSGDYSAKVREVGPPELVRLSQGVNDMAHRLAAMRTSNQRLEAQLRTLQDEERADLARDLHDEIGPHLFAVNVDAAMARRLVTEGRPDLALSQIQAIQDAVGHMQRLVRDILGRLRPTELIELGLKAAIDELVAFWGARHPAIRFRVRVPDDEALAIPEETRETLYRVIQEGLNNAVRHGRPAEIHIDVLQRPGGTIVARVSDDGAPTGKSEGAGFGLRGMRERVAAARGRVTVTKGPGGGGWTVEASIPPPSPSGESEEATAA